MAQPTSLLPGVRGIGRDFAIDELPPGFVWDLVDWIPNRRGAKLEGRGPWKYHTSGAALAGTIFGGKHAAYNAGTKLLVWAGSTLYDHPDGATPGTPTAIGTLFASGLQNGVMLRDRVYFPDGQGAALPKAVTYNGTTFSITSLPASAPKARLLEVYKDRLIATAAPTNPQRVSFSPLETDGGPPGAWDPLSYVDTSSPVTAFAPMGAQILAFHSKSLEKIRGSVPPGAGLDTDMFIDTFSDQLGCEDPASVCNWQENVIFANSRGVHLTDGATIRSLTDQGSIGDVWRIVYGRKRAGTQVTAGVFLDYLIVTVLTDFTPVSSSEDRPITFVCNLNTRTWFRFGNIDTTCWIESEQGVEEMWGGLDVDKKLMRLSQVFVGNIDLPEEGVTPPLATNSIDADGTPVLPYIDLGWKRMGPEGVKRLRHIYISQQSRHIQSPGVISPSGTVDIFAVEYQVNLGTEIVITSFLPAGNIRNDLQYSRDRLNVGRRGYGIRLIVRQIEPAYISRLFDVAVDEWPQDRGKL